MRFQNMRNIFASVMRFAELPRSQKYLVTQTLMLVLCIRIALSVFSLRRIVHFLRRISQGRSSPKRNPSENIVHAVRVVGRLCPGATCLVNGLAGHYLLRQNGYEPILHIGVKKSNDRSIAAHAWVCMGREVVIGATDDLDTYIPFQGFSERL